MLSQIVIYLFVEAIEVLQISDLGLGFVRQFLVLLADLVIELSLFQFHELVILLGRELIRTAAHDPVQIVRKPRHALELLALLFQVEQLISHLYLLLQLVALLSDDLVKVHVAQLRPVELVLKPIDLLVGQLRRTVNLPLFLQRYLWTKCCPFLILKLAQVEAVVVKSDVV